MYLRDWLLHVSRGFWIAQGLVYLWVLYWVYLFMVLQGMTHAVYLQLLACKEPSCDNIEIQLISQVSWKNSELTHTPGCTGRAPTFVLFYSVYSTPCMSSTSPVMTPFLCPKLSCRKKFTSYSWPIKHNRLHHPEHHQVTCQMNRSIQSMPQRIEHSHCGEFNTNNDSVEDLDVFHYLERVENITDSQSQPPPPPLPQTEAYTATRAPLSKSTAELWERDAQDFLQTNLQNNPSYLFATCEEYNYIHHGIKKKYMKTYSDNVLKEESIAPRFPSHTSGVHIQKLVPRIPDDQALWEWELYTLEDMTWNDNYQRLIKNRRQDIIKCMRLLMRQLAYAEHCIYAPQRCLNSDTPRTCLYTEIHTADGWWATQVKRHTQG